ncbi:MAG: peroxidase [Acidobacteria bacterium]|nr:peroxidase [Acidobacteriota bacterium]
MIFDPIFAPMYLPKVEDNPDAKGAYADVIRAARASGSPVSQIWNLFAFAPEAAVHLERFTEAIMRGPGPLSPGMRELIAAYTSVRNQCMF